MLKSQRAWLYCCDACDLSWVWLHTGACDCILISVLIRIIAQEENGSRGRGLAEVFDVQLHCCIESNRSVLYWALLNAAAVHSCTGVFMPKELGAFCEEMTSLI